MIRRLARWALIFIGVWAVLSVAAVVAIRIWFPPEKVKALLVQQVEERLGRQLEMGTASIGLYSGLRIEDLRLSERPNFETGTFIGSHDFALKFAWLPLLKKQLVIREIRLDRPQVRIVQEADGRTYNFSDLVTPSPTASVPAPAPLAKTEGQGGRGLPLSLVISRARLTNGSIAYVKKQVGGKAPQVVKLEPINLDVAGGFNTITQTLTLKRLHLAVGESKLSLSGTVIDAMSERPQLDLGLTIERFVVDPWLAFASLPPAIKVQGWVQAKLNVKGTLEAPEVSGSVDATQLAFASLPQVNKAAGVPCRLTLETAAKKKKELALRRLEVVLGGFRLEGQGTVSDLTSPLPRVDIKLSTNEFAPRELLGLLPGVALPKELTLGGGIKLRLQATGTPENLTASGSLDFTPLDVRYADLFHKPAASVCRIVSDVTYRTVPRAKPPVQEVTLQPVTVRLGDAEFTLRGQVHLLPTTQRLDVKLTSNRWPIQGLAGLSRMAKPYQPEGHAVLNLTVSGTSAAPKFQGQLELEDVGAQYGLSKLSGVRTQLDFTDDSVTMSSLTGKLDGEPIQLAFSVVHFKRPEVKVDGTIAKLDVGKLLPQSTTGKPGASAATPPAEQTTVAQSPASQAPTISSSGRLTLRKVLHPNFEGETIALAWRLSDITPPLNKLSGTVTLNTGRGTLSNLTSLAGSSPMAKVVLLPITLMQKLESLGLMKFGLPSFMDITYRTIKGEYVATNGVVTVKTFRIESAQLDVATKGTIDLANNQVDLQIVSKLPPGSVAGSVGQFTTDSDGRPTLPLLVKGSLTSPSVRPDVKAVTTGVVQGVGRELLKRIGVGGTSQGQETAAPAEGAGSQATGQPQGQSSQPPAQQPSSVEELGRELLKGIFKK